MLQLEIVILHSGRVNRLKECLARVAPLAQSAGVTVRVSDNSGKQTAAPLAENYPTLRFTHRTRCTFPEHFNVNAAEAEADVVVLLHDDDAVKPDYIEAIRAAFADPAVVAVSTNAQIEGAQGSSQTLFASLPADQTLHKPDELLVAYFAQSTNMFCPFSLYAYRRATLLERRYRDDVAGKYSDVSFIASLLELGAIRWLAAPLGIVGHHGDNDSHNEASRDRALQFNAMERLPLAPATLRLARRHIGRKIFLKLAADLYHFRKPALGVPTYLSIARRCLR